MEATENTATARPPWNKGRIVGQKTAFQAQRDLGNSYSTAGGALADEFPNSSHVNLAGLTSATDLEIWAYAREHDFAVVFKDDDFRSLSLVNGAPPKVIWLRIGTASTAAIEAFIRSTLVKIRTFEISAEESLLVLS